MSAGLDVSSLLTLVRAYYPPGIDADDPRYQQTEQAKRLRALMDGMARAMGAKEELTDGLAPIPDEVLELGATVAAFGEWPSFVRRLRDEFPGCKVWDKTVPWYDPSFACQISWPNGEYGESARDAIVCVLSMLAPVYAIYGMRQAAKREHWMRFPPLPMEFQAREAQLAELIEAEFGFARLDNEVLTARVADLVPHSGNLLLGEAELVDCLLTTERPRSDLTN